MVKWIRLEFHRADGATGVNPRFFLSNALDVFGDQRLVFLDPQTKLVPIEPLLRDVPDVAEIPLPQFGRGQQFVEQRLVGLARRGEWIELDASASLARAEALVGIVRENMEAAL